MNALRLLARLYLIDCEDIHDFLADFASLEYKEVSKVIDLPKEEWPAFYLELRTEAIYQYKTFDPDYHK